METVTRIISVILWYHFLIWLQKKLSGWIQNKILGLNIWSRSKIEKSWHGEGSTSAEKNIYLEGCNWCHWCLNICDYCVPVHLPHVCNEPTCGLCGRELNCALQCWLSPWASSWALSCSAHERETREVRRRRVFRLQSAGYWVHTGAAVGALAWGL